MAGGATQEKAFAAMCEGDLERERTEDKARQKENKIRPRSFAAVKPIQFLNLKQVQAGWIPSKKWRMDGVQNPFLGANSNTAQSGPKGIKHPQHSFMSTNSFS